MKRFLSALCSYLIAFSPVMARDIVAPRSDEDIRIITKPGGTPTTSMRVDGSTGVPEVDSLKADSVEEKTSDNGVSIDGVTLKDGVVTGSVEGDATIVRTTGTQSIDGTKTFNDTISGDIDGDSATTSDSTVVRTTRSVSTGSGLTGGGNLSADRTLSVDSTVVRTTGTQSIDGTKTFNDTISGDIDGDSATTSDSTVVRTTRSVSTGSGLTGGGNLSTDRTLSVDSSVVRTSGNQNIFDTKTFIDDVVADNLLGATGRRGLGYVGQYVLSPNNDAPSGAACEQEITDGDWTDSNAPRLLLTKGIWLVTARFRVYSSFGTYVGRVVLKETGSTNIYRVSVNKINIGFNDFVQATFFLATDSYTSTRTFRLNFDSIGDEPAIIGGDPSGMGYAGSCSHMMAIRIR